MIAHSQALHWQNNIEECLWFLFQRLLEYAPVFNHQRISLQIRNLWSRFKLYLWSQSICSLVWCLNEWINSYEYFEFKRSFKWEVKFLSWDWIILRRMQINLQVKVQEDRWPWFKMHSLNQSNKELEFLLNFQSSLPLPCNNLRTLAS